MPKPVIFIIYFESKKSVLNPDNIDFSNFEKSITKFRINVFENY